MPCSAIVEFESHRMMEPENFVTPMSTLAAEALADSSDRREPLDRRQRPTSIFSRFALSGRRRGGRRDGETRNIYVDRYSSEEWLLASGVLVLSFADLVFTLVHLSVGGKEANPVMDWFLQIGGTHAFTIAKTAFTLLGVSVLLLHVRFDRVKVLMRLAFALYLALFVFHFYVISVR